MIEQLALLAIPVEPTTLPTNQRLLHEAIQRAGGEGAHTDELGALLCEHRYQHSRDDRCLYCSSNAKPVLNALQAKGLVRYRRAKNGNPGAWLPNTTSDPADDTSLPRGMSTEIPY